MDYNANFEADYKRETEIYTRYREAETETEKESVRAEKREFDRYLVEKGEDYILVYELYEKARKCGNKQINLDDVHGTPAEIVNILRKYGVSVFTLSSRWSGLIDTIAEFINAGCTFCGITTINANFRRIDNAWETEKAIVFYIQEA